MATKAIFRIPQYPISAKSRFDLAVCLGKQCEGEVLEATLSALQDFEWRMQAHLKPEARRDPREYVFIAEMGFQEVL